VVPIRVLLVILFLVLVLVFSAHKAVPGVVVLIAGVYRCLLASFQVREARVLPFSSCLMFLYCVICYWNIGYSLMLVWWWLTVWKMLRCESGRDDMHESRWVLLDSPKRAGWSLKTKALLKRGAVAWARIVVAHPLSISRARLCESR